MEINIRFNYEDEADRWRYEQMMRSAEVECILSDIDNKLRSIVKHGVDKYGMEDITGVSDLAEKVRADIGECLIER